MEIYMVWTTMKMGGIIGNNLAFGDNENGFQWAGYMVLYI